MPGMINPAIADISASWPVDWIQSTDQIPRNLKHSGTTSRQPLKGIFRASAATRPQHPGHAEGHQARSQSKAPHSRSIKRKSRIGPSKISKDPVLLPQLEGKQDDEQQEGTHGQGTEIIPIEKGSPVHRPSLNRRPPSAGSPEGPVMHPGHPPATE